MAEVKEQVKGKGKQPEHGSKAVPPEQPTGSDQPPASTPVPPDLTKLSDKDLDDLIAEQERIRVKVEEKKAAQRKVLVDLITNAEKTVSLLLADKKTELEESAGLPSLREQLTKLGGVPTKPVTKTTAKATTGKGESNGTNGSKFTPNGQYNPKPGTRAGDIHQAIVQLAAQGTMTKDTVADRSGYDAGLCQAHLKSLTHRAVMVEVSAGVFEMVSK